MVDTKLPSPTTLVDSGTSQTFTHTWTSPGKYKFKVRAENSLGLKGSNAPDYYVTLAASTVGACGSNHKSTYVYPDTSYMGNFCNEGNPSPATPAFPAPGATVNWTCSGSPAANCSATRSATMPPNTPIITASTGNTYRVGETQSFTLAATDPNSPSKTIRYGVDYRNNTTLADYLSTATMDLSPDVWIPSSSTYVTSGTSQTFTKSWAAPGTYIFRIRSQNDASLNSTFSAPFTVNIINEPLINGVVNPASCKNYAKTETAFVAPFCSSGTVKATDSSGVVLSPVQDPIFPAAGLSAYWKCFGSGGGTDSALCISTHLAITCGTAIDSPKITAPSSNLCFDGATSVAATSAVTLSANGKTYLWTCGTSPTVACSVPKTIVKVIEQ
jgi:plastocyanin